MQAHEEQCKATNSPMVWWIASKSDLSITPSRLTSIIVKAWWRQHNNNINKNGIKIWFVTKAVEIKNVKILFFEVKIEVTTMYNYFQIANKNLKRVTTFERIMSIWSIQRWHAPSRSHPGTKTEKGEQRRREREGEGRQWSTSVRKNVVLSESLLRGRSGVFFRNDFDLLTSELCLQYDCCRWL